MKPLDPYSNDINKEYLKQIKAILPEVFTEVKETREMLYIDPPYNTGNDFIYEDDFSDSIGGC